MATDTLQNDLTRAAGRPVTVTLTRNRRRLLTVKRTRRAVEVRMHEALAHAPQAVREALRRFVADGCKESGRLIRIHLSNVAGTDAAPARPVRIQTVGRHHHLGALLNQVTPHFPKVSRPLITWGPVRRPGLRQVRLASYDAARRLIRVNPLLDHPDVPHPVLRHVIYHEMAHHALAGVTGPGKEGHHGPRFKALERLCPDRETAAAWQKKHLPGHLARVRAGYS